MKKNNKDSLHERCLPSLPRKTHTQKNKTHPFHRVKTLHVNLLINLHAILTFLQKIYWPWQKKLALRDSNRAS